MQSFCVIPHSIRNDPFFDAVYEDGIRITNHGRLVSLPFSRVLSPAHDIHRHVLGPLLEAVHERRPATLVVAIPTPSSHSSDPVIQDCSAIALDLYAHLLPLLFHSAPSCDKAMVSVVTVSANDRVVIDEVRSRKCRSLMEVQRLAVARETSARQWGGILQVLTDRHNKSSTTSSNINTAVDESLTAQTVCLVVVEMEGHSRVTLVDAGSDQDVLQSLTLIMGSNTVSGQRTYPPNTPLRSLLVAQISRDAAIHVVSVPNPACDERNTMRVLRFASECAQMDTRTTSPPLPPSVLRGSNTSSTSTSSEKSYGVRRADSQGRHQSLRNSSLTPILDSAQERSQSPTSTNLKNMTTTVQCTPSPLPTRKPEADYVRMQQHEEREQHLLNRVALLEKQLRESASQQTVLRDKCKESADRADVLQGALRERERECQTLRSTLEKAKPTADAAHSSVNQRIAAAVEAQREETRSAEQVWRRQRKELEHSLHVAEQSNAELRDQLSKLTQELVAATEAQAAMAGRREDAAQSAASLEQKRRVDSVAVEELRRRSAELEAFVVRLQLENDRLHHIAEMHPAKKPNNSWHATEQCVKCNGLEAQLHDIMKELSLTRREKSELLDTIVAVKKEKEEILTRQHLEESDARHVRKTLFSSQSHGSNEGSNGSLGAVHGVISSLMSGCASLDVQLDHIASSVQQCGDHIVSLDMIAEHKRAIGALSSSVHAIGSRRWSEGATTTAALAETATAADAAPLGNLLSFEKERCIHLMAFLPTFAQLAVSVEHMKMRMNKGACYGAPRRPVPQEATT